MALIKLLILRRRAQHAVAKGAKLPIQLLGL
jgi:hypothetical protein